MSRLFLVILLFPGILHAQKKINLTINGGASNYTGDLQEKKFTLDQSNLTLGVGLSYEIFPKLLARGGIQYGKLSANDKFSKRQQLKDRNLNFQSRLLEGSLLLDYSLFDLQADKKITPYVFAGIAVFGFDPYTFDHDNAKVYLHDLGTEGQGLPEYPNKKSYKLTQFAIPFGGGIRYRINENTYLGYEIGLRKLSTDYLDDVSGTYADQNLLLAARGPKAVELAFRSDELKSDLPYPASGTVRGGAQYKDWYYFSTITLSIGLFNNNPTSFNNSRRGSVDCPSPL